MVIKQQLQVTNFAADLERRQHREVQLARSDRVPLYFRQIFFKVSV